MSPRTVLTGGEVLVGGTIRPADVAIVGGRIAAIGPDLAQPGDDRIEVPGCVVAPGYVDLQINGAVGVDVTSQLADAPERLWDLAAWLPTVGVTAFLPTVVSAPAAAVSAALAALHTGPPPGWVGATPLGLHVEGPMLAPAGRGTHAAEHLRAPDLALVEGWTAADGVRLVTIAPELPGALSVIAHLVERGVVVSVGHTAATYEEVRAGLDAGARAGTHLFNAMSGLAARDPGAVGALLADDRAIVGVIVDGVHVHPGSVAAAWRALGPDRLALVSDAVAGAGLPDGTAQLGGIDVTVRDGAVRNPDGGLAGSALTLDGAVRNLAAWTDASAGQAIAAASTVPARALGDDERGELRPGARADVVVLTPELEVVATFVGGRPAATVRPDRIHDGVAGATSPGSPG